MNEEKSRKLFGRRERESGEDVDKEHGTIVGCHAEGQNN